METVILYNRLMVTHNVHMQNITEVTATQSNSFMGTTGMASTKCICKNSYLCPDESSTLTIQEDLRAISFVKTFAQLCSTF